MPPMKNILNSTTRYAKFASQSVLGVLSRTVQAANLQHFAFGEFRHPVFSAARRSLRNISPLLDHVAIVIRTSAEKKMVRVNATRHIAFVKNTQPVRNWPDVNNVGQAMGKDNFPIHPQQSMSKQLLRSLPKPTGIGFERAHLKTADSQCGYDLFSHGVNLRDRFASWLGSHEKSRSLAGRFAF